MSTCRLNRLDEVVGIQGLSVLQGCSEFLGTADRGEIIVFCRVGGVGDP